MSETTATMIASRLRAEIEGGAWPPGAALRQEELAARYGASRIPVREALSLLRADGLVIIEPNRGAFIPTPTIEQIDEFFDLRLMLESDALAHALARHDRRSLLRLEALQAELEIEETRSGWLAGDGAFHEALHAPSGRRRTLELIRALRAQTERYALSRLHPGSRRRPWAEEHRALIRAIAKGDREKAIATLKLHLRETQSAVRAAIQQAER